MIDLNVDKKIDTKSELGDQDIFNYHASVDKKEFEGGKGEGVAIELGKDLFLKGFDKQLIGVKKNEKKKLKTPKRECQVSLLP